MRRGNVGLVVAALCAIVLGCNYRGARPEGMTAQQVDTVRQMADRITAAPSAREQARSLAQFRQFTADNGYTFTTAATDLHSGSAVPVPARHFDPVRVHVRVYRQKDLVHTFVFMPHDNHDLSLLEAPR